MIRRKFFNNYNVNGCGIYAHEDGASFNLYLTDFSTTVNIDLFVHDKNSEKEALKTLDIIEDQAKTLRDWIENREKGDD